jgi:Protein of unknown function (DUF1553)/Protein of unknown function (DUF1549)/Planctomycete cytochrome C
MRVSLLLIAELCLTVSVASADDQTVPSKPKRESSRVTPEHAEFFEARIRPILAEHCVSCHGPKKQQAGLRLDSQEGLQKGAESGPVVAPGQPEESPLIDAIKHDSAIKMPPKSKLPDQAIVDLTTWVQMGAPWPNDTAAHTGDGAGGTRTTSSRAARSHWAFQAIKDVPPPAVKDTGWSQAPIDRFILARLEANGLSPSPQASKLTLLRRATFDLTGLPPTPEDLQSFEADSSPSAYERLIDQLLASPRYGERWGRFWLDVARYADTKGYILFQEPEFHWAFTYRDYVIGALNRDLTYDQFVIEQLAADRLPPVPGQRPLQALGFLTVGGRFMGNFHDVIDDRIDVVCRGLMSLTVTCARCHDHKFDPIPTQDYYSLYGVLASAREPAIPPEVSEAPRTADYQRFVQELATRQSKLSDFVATKHHELVESAKSRMAEYLLAAQRALDYPTTEDFMLLADGNDLNPPMIVRWQAYLLRTRKEHDPVFAPWHALATLPEREFASRAASLIASFRTTRAHTDITPVGNPVVIRALVACPPRSLADVASVYARLLRGVDLLWQDSNRRAMLDDRTIVALPVPALESLRQVLYGADAPPNIAMIPYGDLGLLPDRPSQAKLKELRDGVQNWLTSGPGAPPRALSVEDAPTPVESRVFIRGNSNNLGDPAPRRFLASLAGTERKPFQDGSGRLELARAIASRDNPLTARALVNRIWMHHFGTPLVATPGDFGLRSEPPVHSELLDHLAARFMDEGWSIKKLHRWIMLSSTFQQQSTDRADARQLDPENALYWRMNRRRLDFEATRDALLAVAGGLDERIGGPPMPSLTSPASNRRTLYGFIDRLNLPGIYRTFDFPDPTTTSPRRDQTTVAPQALFLMNHPFVIGAADGILHRASITASNDADARVERLYRLIYNRPPGDPERVLARGFLGRLPAEPDRWRSFAQALLMANEFVYVD